MITKLIIVCDKEVPAKQLLNSELYDIYTSKENDELFTLVAKQKDINLENEKPL